MALVEDLLDREEWARIDLEQIQDGLNGRGWYVVERFELADDPGDSICLCGAILVDGKCEVVDCCACGPRVRTTWSTLPLDRRRCLLHTSAVRRPELGDDLGEAVDHAAGVDGVCACGADCRRAENQKGKP